MIDVFWYRGDPQNFGDELNPFMVSRLSGQPVRFRKNSSLPWPKTHMVIGSILEAATRNCIVWGSGVAKSDQKIHGGKFHAVRGPLSRNCVLDSGYHCPTVYGDPGLLLPLVRRDDVTIQWEVGVIPHYVDLPLFKAISLPDSWNLIDLTDSVPIVLEQILQCEKTISSSLHGLIVSHAYGRESAWIKLSDNIYGDGVKFIDYFKSVNIQEPSASAVRPEMLSATNFNYLRVKERDLRLLQQGLLEVAPFPLLDGLVF